VSRNVVAAAISLALAPLAHASSPGYNNGEVSTSYATGNVSGTDYNVRADNNVGRPVGSNGSNGTISSSYARGNATGGNAVGGLVGNNNGSIANTNPGEMEETAQRVGG
jgi:hypothetical protein